MKNSKFSEVQIIKILSEQNQGKTVNEICREHGISQPTFYKWKSKYGGLDVQQLTKMKELVWENTCAFRMSKGLNYSGFKLPFDNSKYKAKRAKGGVHKGDDKLNYWYRVKELGKYLEEHLGKPEFDETLKKAELGGVKEGLSKEKWDKLHKMKGIVMFQVSGWENASGHFTLWDGNNLIYPGLPQHDDPNSQYYYFKMKYEQYHSIKRTNIVVQTDEIKLWELK
ncbi:T6SS effector amidase Tae4 family protein [Chryseobacterium sp. JK1]|uniref:T6SS effector amidase Tae4 family protein n=1 Tax=Chryseobacterium sp. JK1 TaxID=874294 RepID=UPI003D694A34